MPGSPRETTAAIPPWTRADAHARERLGPVAGAAVTVLALAATLWLGFRGANLADWTIEARPSVDALLAAHLGAFLQRAPAYGGSLLLRAPFMVLVAPWAHHRTIVYVAGAVPCVAALMALAVWLSGRLAPHERGRLLQGATVAICVANPIALTAIQQGHPEELLGAALCVAAVLCAQRDHAVWSGILVGAAIANKPWGVLAAGPVMVALPRRRAHAIGAMVATAGLILAPFALDRSGGLVAQSRAIGLGTGQIFNPWQLWWFFGSPSGGVLDGRVGPGWLQGLGHALPVVVMPPLTLAYATFARREVARMRHDALLLLALLLFLRCALDPWDVVYYPVPFLTALVAWETLTYERPPVMAAVASLTTWFVFDGAAYAFRQRQDPLAALFTVVAFAALTAFGRRLMPASATPERRPQGRPAANR